MKIFHKMRLGKKPRAARNYYEKKTIIYGSALVVFALALGAIMGLVALNETGILALGSNDDDPPCVGSACGDDTDVSYTDCSGYVCYAKDKAVSGFSWVYVPASSASDYMPYSSFKMFQYPGMILTASGVTHTAVEGCGDVGFYIFARNTYYGNKWATVSQRGKSTGYMAGPENLSAMQNLGQYHNFGFHWSDGAQQVGYDEAYNAYDAAREQIEATGVSWEGGNLTWFCAWGGERDPDPITVKDCGHVSVTSTAYYGDTKGSSKVINYTSSSYNDKFYDDYVIGKPGDTVQFCHSLSYGNRYVGSGLSGDVGVNDPGGSYDQSFKITASRDGVDTPNLRFPLATSILAGTVTQRTTANITDGLAAGSTVASLGAFNTTGVDKGDYWFTVYSPFTEPKYQCSYSIYNSSGHTPYTPNGFQIPGFVGPSCAASTNTGESNQAGRVLAQKISYDEMKAWDKRRNSRSGSCGCNVNDRSITNLAEAEDYVTSASYWGWSSLVDGAGTEYNVCNTNGNCCTATPACSCDAYGNNCSCCAADTKTNYSYKSHSISHNTIWKNYGEKSDDAKVYIPYNYTSTVESKIQQEVKFLGASVTVNASYTINKRTNAIASPDMTDYATITPAGKFRLYELLLPEDYSGVLSGTDNYGKLDGTANKKDVCAFYGADADHCKLIGSQDGPFNKAGDYRGEGPISYGRQVRQIPDDDEWVGWKYCVASSIYPAASHDDATNNVSNNTGGSALSQSANGNYNISGLSCVTIAKKPNFQVWNGGIFTNGSISTSVSKKMVDSEFGTEYGTTGRYRVYGSWDEYAIIARGSVNGMASGAALGYNAGYNFTLPYGGVNRANAEMQKVSPETVSNNTSSAIGNSGITGLNSNVLSRLKARYRDEVSSHDTANDGYVTQNTDTGTQYVYATSDTTLSSLIGNGYKYTFTNYNGTVSTTTGYCSFGTGAFCTNTMARVGNGLRKTTTAASSQADNTLIIYVKGTLTIDGNICYSSTYDECANSEPTKLSSYSLSTTAVSSLPQVLIFAQNVVINENVNRVEAWIILDEDTGDGRLKTCQVGDPHMRQCNKTLVITGPVFAKKLSLTRTAGSNHGIATHAASSDADTILGRNLAADGSIAPAEIFNLRPDAYYWAYNQAQRSTEAVTTYVRELAPRY